MSSEHPVASHGSGASTAPAADGAPASVAVDPSAGVPRPKRRTTTTNLVLALGATLGLVLLLVLMVPRPNAIQQPPFDVNAAAKAAAPSLSFTPAVAVPTGWKVTSADVRTDSGDLPTWTVNYLTDTGRYVGLMQAGSWTQGWQSSLTQGGTPAGSVTINGATWNVYDKAEKEITSLMLRQDGLTTLVLAKAGGVPDAQVLAKTLTLQS